MAKTFHLAIPITGNLDKTIEFYCNVLGCKKGNSQNHPFYSWCDIDFWGNELTLHSSINEFKVNERHFVDKEDVTIPHFGVHLDAKEFKSLKEKLLQENVEFVNEPYIRFGGEVLEQITMFIKDPSGNIMEFKTMINPDALFGEE